MIGVHARLGFCRVHEFVVRGVDKPRELARELFFEGNGLSKATTSVVPLRAAVRKNSLLCRFLKGRGFSRAVIGLFSSPALAAEGRLLNENDFSAACSVVPLRAAEFLGRNP